jgi:hypothetical protein
MLRHVALSRTDVSEERNASIIRVSRIGEIGITLALTTEARCEESVLARATRRNNTNETILHSHRREALMSYSIIFLENLTAAQPINESKEFADRTDS